MKEKIAYLMKSEGLTTTRLAEILGTQPSRISHIVSGRNNPSYDLLQTILRRFPRINPDWLLLDSADVYRDDSSTPPPFPDSESDSLSVNLFAHTPEGAPLFSSNSAADSQHKNQRVSTSDLGASPGQNSAQKNTAHDTQNRGNFPVDILDSSARVERIIVLYSDNTFRTYNLR